MERARRERSGKSTVCFDESSDEHTTNVLHRASLPRASHSVSGRRQYERRCWVPSIPDVAESPNNSVLLSNFTFCNGLPALSYFCNAPRSLRLQDKYEEAGPLHQRALAMGEKVYGPDHPRVGVLLNKRALLLMSQVRAVRIFHEFSSGGM